MTTRSKPSKATRPQVIDANRMYTARELEARGIGRVALMELIKSGDVKYRDIGTKGPWILGEDLLNAAKKRGQLNSDDSPTQNRTG